MKVLAVCIVKVLRCAEHYPVKCSSWASCSRFVCGEHNFTTRSPSYLLIFGEGIEDSKGFISSESGFGLSAFGRLTEAIELILADFQGLVAGESWRNAAKLASNLSELYVTIGNLAMALECAQQGVDLADRSNNSYERSSKRAMLETVYHQTGDLQKAEDLFQFAEKLQRKNNTNLPVLYSLWGYYYCDLLIDRKNYYDARHRASQTLKLAEKYLGKGMGYLDIGLDNLSLGRAHLLQAQQQNTAIPIEVPTYLNDAVNDLRRSATQHMLARGLLARAEYYRVVSDFKNTQKDLDEAFTIATRGGMGLYLADCHLEYARLYLAKSENDKAREHWEIAKKSINEMGYHRRDKEVQELEVQLK